MILVNMQNGLLPNAWKFVHFDCIKQLIRKFHATPLADTANQTGQVALFRRHSSRGAFEREFIDWRKAFLFLLLISGPIPTNDQKREYFDDLKKNQDDGGLINHSKFLKTASWFDKYEGLSVSASRVMTVSGIMSDLESIEEEDDCDKERCRALKELMFKTYRVPNQQGLDISDFTSDLDEIFCVQGDEGVSLYNTVLHL